MMVHLEGYFPEFCAHVVVHIDTFLLMQLKGEIQIELNSNFNIKTETKYFPFDISHIKTG